MMIRLLTLLALLTASLGGAQAQNGKAPADLVKPSLVAEPAAIEPGKTFTAAVRLALKPGWHVYWRNPGDSGLPPEIAWDLPQRFSAGAIEWPAPERIPVQHLMNYGYEDEVILLVPLTAPDALDAGSVPLHAKLNYLVCEEICIPGSGEVSVDVPVAEKGKAPGTDPANAELFARARKALPKPSPWPARLTQNGDRLVLNLDTPDLRPEAVKDAAFFPYSETALDNAAEQALNVDGKGLHLALTRADTKEPPPKALAGVLAFKEAGSEGTTRRALAIGEPPAAASSASAEAAPGAAAPAAASEESLTLMSAAGLAFLGGLLLNLMPCVFPVLSIKVLSLVKQSGEEPGPVRLHALAYTFGVLASFLALAGLLIALKAAGLGLGWGFQLQSPVVVAALAYLLFAMGLSLSGVVHVGGGISGVGDGLTRRSGLQGSFFTGVLATIVATPCTAPFMGAAVGFALTQPPLVGLTVFACLGLGLALPFLALTLWPAAMRSLPRPGAWMETVKGVLAFPIYATVAWLVWVLSQQVGPNGFFAALIGLVLVGLGAWAWERARFAGSFGRMVGRGAALAALAAAAGLVVLAQADPPADAATAQAGGIESFTQGRLDALRAEGRNVFVDMTAAWCITCQVNERGTLSAGDVKSAFAGKNVAYLKGDWTNRNPEITALLQRHGRGGVPLYLLYAGKAEPAVLPQILTTGIVLAEIEKLKRSEPVRTGALAAPQAR